MSNGLQRQVDRIQARIDQGRAPDEVITAHSADDFKVAVKKYGNTWFNMAPNEHHRITKDGYYVVLIWEQ